jgi:aspartate racemase
VLLMQKVMAATLARDDSDHVPLLVDQNPQVPSRIRHLIEGGGDYPGPVLAMMARRLQGAGATALAMPCNTAHHFAPAIRAAVDVPLIDMVELSVAHARSLAGSSGKVGILASPAVRRIGLFNESLLGAGLTPAYPDDEDAMLAAIRSIKASGVTAPARAALVAASTDLIAQGATLQMIACTEFSLIADAVASGVIAFDTLDVLTSAIIAYAASGDIGKTKAVTQPPIPSAHAPT